jgi:UDP-N-acetyl-D-glucosamine dehydrogenase
VLAVRINVNMPYYAVSRIARALNRSSRSLRGSRLLLIGVAYKQDVGDTPESPALRLLELLRAEGAEVDYHDPHVAELRDGTRSIALDAGSIAAADCVVIATAHSAVDIGLVVEHARQVVDLRNAVRQRLAGSPAGEVPANVDVL